MPLPLKLLGLVGKGLIGYGFGKLIPGDVVRQAAASLFRPDILTSSGGGFRKDIGGRFLLQGGIDPKKVLGAIGRRLTMGILDKAINSLQNEGREYISPEIPSWLKYKEPYIPPTLTDFSSFGSPGVLSYLRSSLTNRRGF